MTNNKKCSVCKNEGDLWKVGSRITDFKEVCTSCLFTDCFDAELAKDCE